MLLVFILLSITFLFILILLFFAKIKFYIVIENNTSKIKIGLSLFGVPLFKYKINKKKINKKRKQKTNNKKDKSLRRKISKNDILYEIKKLSKKRGIYLEKTNADLKISTGDAVATSIAVAMVSNAIIFLLKSTNVVINAKEFRYSVTPIYKDIKIFEMDLDCIICVSLVHIISIIISKWRCDRYGRKTSNRKSNDYSYEQHKRDDRRKHDYWRSDKSNG